MNTLLLGSVFEKSSCWFHHKKVLNVEFVDLQKNWTLADKKVVPGAFMQPRI